MAGIVLTALIVLPLVSDPYLDDGYAGLKVSALRVIGLLGAVAFLGYTVGGGSLARGATPRIDLPLAVFAGLLVAASIASVDPGQSLVGEPYQYQGLMTVLLYIGSFYVARLSLGDPGGFRKVLIATVATGAVVSTYGIAQWFGFDPFWSGPPDERIISSVGQPNDLAGYLILVVIAAFGLWPAAGRPLRMGLTAVVVLAMVAVALTFSRGGYIGLAVGLGILLLPRLHAPAKRSVGAIAVAIVGGMLVVALAIPLVRTTAESVVDRAVATFDLGESSARFHLDQWRVGSQIALEHPLLGTGPETFPLVFRPYLDQVLPADRAELLGRFRLESPHNQLIGIAAELGLPALTAFVIFLAACVRACARRARVGDGTSRSIALVVLAALASNFMVYFFKTPDVTTSEVLWITIGAGLSAMGDGRTLAPSQDAGGR